MRYAGTHFTEIELSSHLVEGERGVEVLEASQGRSTDRGCKLHQSAALCFTHLRHHLQVATWIQLVTPNTAYRMLDLKCSDCRTVLACPECVDFNTGHAVQPLHTLDTIAHSDIQGRVPCISEQHLPMECTSSCVHAPRACYKFQLCTALWMSALLSHVSPVAVLGATSPVRGRTPPSRRA